MSDKPTNDKAAVESLRAVLKSDISRFDQESKKHKGLHRACQTAVITLTALTTVAAGIGLIRPELSGRYVEFTVLCLSATSAAVSGWAEMRRARELWRHEREVYYALLDIQREMDFVEANSGLMPADLAGFFQSMDA